VIEAILAVFSGALLIERAFERRAARAERKTLLGALMARTPEASVAALQDRKRSDAEKRPVIPPPIGL
jgi:hypothetical protein